jgi:hypothetical protein
MPTSAQRQFLISVAGVPGFFSRRSGADVEAEASREFDGGSLTPEVLTGPGIPGDLVGGRGYKPERDADVLARLRPLVGRWRTTITAQPTDRDLVPTGRPTVYTGTLIRTNDPEADANSGDVARWELSFAIEDVA